MYFIQVAFLTICFVSFYLCHSINLLNERMPTLGITVLARNKEGCLPYFMNYLKRQNYPKNRIYLRFVSDHNEDKTREIIDTFVVHEGMLYAEITVTGNDDEKRHSDEKVSTNWTPKRYKHVVNLRDEAIELARQRNIDYHLMLDADVFLTNENAITILVNKNNTVVAPLLITDGHYSNFWCAMTEEHYYKWTEEYDKIRSKEKVGCFKVPMVHSAVLVKTKRVVTDYLVYDKNRIYDYDGPDDDIITFAMSAQSYGIDMYVCNDHEYGFMTIPVEDGEDPIHEEDQLLNTKLAALASGVILKPTEYLHEYIKYPLLTTLGMDKIYMINLERRIKRRVLMIQSFKELGLEVQIVSAVDGQRLDLGKFMITELPGYEDPYHHRPMKLGEVGCFLSHFKIWKDVVVNGFKRVLVLEDDVHFGPYFKNQFLQLLEEMANIPDWDLMYIGRKALNAGKEEVVSDHIVRPRYTYWTLGYMLSLNGAAKLLAADPLSKMLPVDEFLPIMFDQHPNDTWKSFFPVRNLNAFSADPLLVEPTHYTGQEGYISDTEDSDLLDTALPEFESLHMEL